ncbi:hypothetical protein TTHERM_000998861 (macronuclear) [Tetrahymena thermophila SB210]|uniref:Uncharacterized protein n=1 Tax=Tetrahymena thermophila (strain SB210) TaxID=312017 RepID=W7XBH0_TETTS|nr:hypothetical protein TTHERM_000998861 [Tetrahymena thermophila SB210]EWS73763.1 hypothetical protein TTHERM_000998861 [Tetrahymena thermophila SB210]|eukprot:XP_012653694.1 hypothetical protein TTHERM_000998861 [Tetrahymena thermophila SB210]
MDQIQEGQFIKNIFVLQQNSFGYIISIVDLVKLITSISNPCLKQAFISYDANYVYSICPNDIIIYNRISFEQQFYTINRGISEANNVIRRKQLSLCFFDSVQL